MRNFDAFAPVGGHLEIRRRGGDAVGMRGYAAVFNQVEHGEVVRPGAFDRTLKHGGDIKLLVNHEGMPLASTRAGTMDVGVDEYGVWVDVPELDLANPRAAELASVLSRGDVQDMSFGFVAVRENLTADGVRELLEVRMLEASVVVWGWYSGTEVSLKALASFMAEARSGRLPNEVVEQIHALLDAKDLRSDATAGEAVAEAPYDVEPEEEPTVDPALVRLEAAKALIA